MLNHKISVMSFALLILSASSVLGASTQSMPSLKTIQPKKVFSVSSREEGEELQANRGFGDQEGEVRMMNLMMVEGSGYEGMDMSHPKVLAENSKSSHGHMHAGSTPPAAAASAESASTYEFNAQIDPASPRVGANTLTLKVTKAGKPAPKLKLKAQVYMTNMDMGTEEPKVKEVKPGEYQVKVRFSMAGPWAVKIIAPSTEKILEFQAEK